MSLKRHHRRVRRAAEKLYAVMGGRAFRVLVTHPDFHLYANRRLSFRWNYFREAKREMAYLGINFGWIGATIRWKSARGMIEGSSTK